MKVFYTTSEGGLLLIKALTRRGFVNLLEDLEDAGSTDWWSIPSTPFRQSVKLFGIRILERRLFQIDVHSVFVPIEFEECSYQRWDSINGWTSDYIIARLLR